MRFPFFFARCRRPGEQQPVQHGVVQRFGQRPRQICRQCPGDVARCRRVGYPKAALDLAQFQAGERQAKHFADLSHGQSPVRQMPPPRMNESMECGTGDNEVVPRRARPTGVSYPLVGLQRNQWSVCSGIRTSKEPECKYLPKQRRSEFYCFRQSLILIFSRSHSQLFPVV